MLAQTIDPKMVQHAMALAEQKWGPQGLQPLAGHLAPTQDDQGSDAAASDGRRWHVLLCEPQRERMACAGLVGRGFKAIAPEAPVWTTRGVRRTKVQVMRPLLRGYIFARMDVHRDADRWHKATAVPGIHKFLRLDNGYGVVHEREMARLLHQAEMKIELAETDTPFEAGEMVRIGSGPFSGLGGDVVRVDSGERITVRVEFMGRGVPLKMSIHEVEKL